MSQLVKKRVDGLDILKCIAAFLIICIHAPFFGEFGKYVTAIARIGVPIFLMITGYFYTSTINKNREKRSPVRARGARADIFLQKTVEKTSVL